MSQRLPMSPKLYAQLVAMLAPFDSCKVILYKHAGKIQRFSLDTTITEEDAEVCVIFVAQDDKGNLHQQGTFGAKPTEGEYVPRATCP